MDDLRASLLLRIFWFKVSSIKSKWSINFLALLLFWSSTTKNTF